MAHSPESSHARGRHGEELACRHLLQAGFRIIERNFRRSTGEVDIIAEHGGVLAFCEVKHWEGMPSESLGRAIDRRKQGRILRTSLWFLKEHPEFQDHQLRYDVVFVAGGRIRHLENAFGGHGVW